LAKVNEKKQAQGQALPAQQGAELPPAPDAEEPEKPRAQARPAQENLKRQITEAEFVKLVESFASRYQAAHPLKKADLRDARREALRKALQGTRVVGWVGTLTEINRAYSSRSRVEGAEIRVRLAGSAVVSLTNKRASAFSDDAVIPRGSRPYNELAELREGDTITFSGEFFAGAQERHYLEETSWTDDGSMSEPWFVFRFTDVSKGQPAPAGDGGAARKREGEAEGQKKQEAERDARQPAGLKEPTVHKMREAVTVGGLSYTVEEVAWASQAQLKQRKLFVHPPNASYLLVKLSVRNDGKAPRRIPYTSLSDANGVVYEATTCRTDGAARLNPGVTVGAWAVFDVTEARKYRLQVRAGSILASEAKLIHLDELVPTLTGHSSGHTNGVNCVAFNPDGTLLASGSNDQTIKLWDVAATREKATLKGHAHWVLSLAFSPDGTLLASGSHDKTVKLWDVKTGEDKATLKGHISGVNSVGFSPDGTLLASASQDGTIKLWDVKTGHNKATLKGHTGWVNSVAFSPDGTLASASQDGTIRLWDVKTGHARATLKGHTGSVWCVALSPDGTLLASGSGSQDKTVKLWDVKTGQEKDTLKGHVEPVTCVAFSPDASLLASASQDGTIKLWDVKTRQETATFKGHTDWVNSVAFSPDASLLASGSADKTIKLWDVPPTKNAAK
jgi:WD40 repeat protein